MSSVATDFFFLGFLIATAIWACIAMVYIRPKQPQQGRPSYPKLGSMGCLSPLQCRWPSCRCCVPSNPASGSDAKKESTAKEER